MSSYKIQIFENVFGDPKPRLRETYTVTVNNVNDAIAEAKKKCRMINDPFLNKCSGRISLSYFRIRNEADKLVYKSTPADMKEVIP